MNEQTKRPVDTRLVEELIKKHYELQGEYQKWQYKVNSSLLIVCATMFAVVVSLHEPSYGICCTKACVFRAVLLLNSLCILCLSVTLYMHIDMGIRNLRNVAKHIREHGERLSRIGDALYDTSVKTPLLYIYTQRFSYFIFILMVIGYTVYCFLPN